MCARMCVSGLFIFQTYFSKPNPDACSCCPSRIHPISQIASHSNICKQNMFIFTSSVGSKNEVGKVARAELARGRNRDKANAPALPPSAKQPCLNRENCHLGRDENEQKKEKISFPSDRGMKNAVGKSGKGRAGLGSPAHTRAHACAAARCHSQLAAGGCPALREAWHLASRVLPCPP